MHSLADRWFLARRHQELLEEAGRGHSARELRRARKRRRRRRLTGDSETAADKRTQVRQGLAEDAPRIAELLELNGVPRWVAFEDRFILAEDEGRLVAVVRFREDSECLFLGLLVAEPWAEEGSVAVDLYTGARVMARELGLCEIRARTRQDETYPREAGYRRWREGWQLDVTGADGDA